MGFQKNIAFLLYDMHGQVGQIPESAVKPKIRSLALYLEKEQRYEFMIKILQSNYFVTVPTCNIKFQNN